MRSCSVHRDGSRLPSGPPGRPYSCHSARMKSSRACAAVASVSGAATDPNLSAPRLPMCSDEMVVLSKLVWSPDTAASINGAMRPVYGAAIFPRRTPNDGAFAGARPSVSAVCARLARPVLENERFVIAGKPLGEPEPPDTFASSRLNGSSDFWPDALDVPGVKNCAPPHWRRRAALWHARRTEVSDGAVSCDAPSRHEAHTEIVGANVCPPSYAREARQTPPTLRERFSDVGRQGVGLAVGAVVVQRKSKCLHVARARALLNLERAKNKIADFGRAVHQIGEIGRGKGLRIACGMKLSGDFPVSARRQIEGDADGPILEASRPDQRRWNIHVSVRGVDGKQRPVDLIAKRGYRTRTVPFGGHIPLAGVRTVSTFSARPFPSSMRTSATFFGNSWTA